MLSTDLIVPSILVHLIQRHPSPCGTSFMNISFGTPEKLNMKET